MQIDPASKNVLSVRCEFCVYFGKDELVGHRRERQQTENVKTWSTFRPEKGLCPDDKKKFFKSVAPFANTLHRHFGRSNEPQHYRIVSDIVENIIGGAFFDPECHGSAAHRRALALFQPQRDDDGRLHVYNVSIKNVVQFQLVVQYLKHGLSFRQVAAVLESAKAVTGQGNIGSMPDAAVSNFARTLMAVNLQSLRDILESDETMAFSLAFDSSTHRGISYLDCRVRFERNGELKNLHMLAIPMFDRHTSVNMFALTVKMLDNVCPGWRKKLIGIGSDGANVMTGRFNGVVTMIEKEAEFSIYRTWCLLHQIDLVAKAKINELFDGKFISSINKISASLRKQESLIREMGGQKCPKMTTRWLALGSWAKWQRQHIESLQAVFDTRNSNQVKPKSWYWPVVAAIAALFYQVDIIIRSLHDRSLLMSQQNSELQKMIQRLIHETEVDGPLSDQQMALREFCEHECSGPWSITHQAVRSSLKIKEFGLPKSWKSFLKRIRQKLLRILENCFRLR